MRMELIDEKCPIDHDSEGVKVVSGNAKMDCCFCDASVGRFSIKYHGDHQFCSSCWNELEPNLNKQECILCGKEYKQDCYQSNVVTVIPGEGTVRQKNCCPDCEDKHF